MIKQSWKGIFSQSILLFLSCDNVTKRTQDQAVFKNLKGRYAWRCAFPAFLWSGAITQLNKGTIIRAQTKNTQRKQVIALIQFILCHQCSYTASNKSTLKSHIDAKHEGIVYPCHQCNAVYTRAFAWSYIWRSMKVFSILPCDNAKLLCWSNVTSKPT